MHERRRDRLDSTIEPMVFRRARAELHAEVVTLFSGRAGIVIGVDRRRMETAPRGHLDPVLPEVVV